MACSIIRDRETGELVQVLAPNGEPSLLFNNALKAFSGNQTQALRAWAVAYTPSFKMKYGDWEKGESFINLDQNGEPTAEIVLRTPAEIQRTINTDFARWEEFQTGSDGWVPEAKALRFKKVLLSKFPDMNIEIVKNPTMEGQAKLEFKTSIKPRGVKYTKAQIAEQQRVVNVVLDKLMSKFPGLTYEWVSPESLKQSDHYFPVGSVRAFVKNNKIYLVKGRVIPEDAIEEVMHVFVEALRQDRPQLFKGLLDNTLADVKYQADYINIRDWYKDNYKGEGLDTLIKSEFLAKALAKAMKSELEINPEGRPVSALGKLLKRFLDWLASVFDTASIIPGQALKDIAAFINSRETEISLPVNQYLYYSADISSSYETNDREYYDSISPKYKGKTVKELNLAKAQEELKKLEKIKEFMIKKFASDEQKRVVDIYIENVNDKIKALEDDEITIGVSKYKGQTALDPKYDKVSELGAGFGNFLHMILEDIQNDYMETGKAPFAIYNREWFDKFYEKNKGLIKFKDMDPTILYNIGLELAGVINGYVIEGKMLLPEITIAKRDVEGQMVIGRLDLVAVDSTGAVDIIDLKTKKVSGLFQGQFSETMFHIGNYKSNWVTEPAAELKEITNRSDVNEYQMQLNIYAEMNKLMGIKVSNRTIIAVAYKYEPNNQDLAKADEFVFNAFAVGKISDANFYRYDSSGRITISEGGIIDQAVKARFNPTIEEEQISEDPKANPFALINDVDQNRMMEKLLELAKKQLDELSENIKQVEKNTSIDIDTQNQQIAILKNRQASIIKVREALEKEKIFGESPESIALAKATLIKSALDTFNQEIKNVTERISSIDLPQTYKVNTEEHRTALKEVSGYITNLDSLREYIDSFRSTILNLNLEKDSRDQLLSVFDKMISDIDGARAGYQNITRGVVKAIINNTMGTKKFAEVFGSLHQMIKPRLDYIERIIAAYENGNSQQARNLLYKISSAVSNLLGNKPTADRIEALKQEAQRLRKLMEINELNDKTIDDYLDSVINSKDSAFYIGSTMSGNKNIADMSDIIGSNADSEMIVNVMYQYMRNVTEDGRRQYLNWANKLDIDALKSAFIKAAGGINEANAMITEQQAVTKEFDINGNVVNSDVHNFYVRPHAGEFEESYNSYKYRLNLYNDQLGEINKQLRESPEGPEKEELKAKKDELRKKQKTLFDEFIEWEIENSETKVKPEIYRLMKASTKFNSEITEKYEEITKIINSAGGEQYLTDEDQETIDGLEADISRIRQEALESSPEDFQTLEELMNNFDYQLNINLWVIKREEIRRQGGEEMLKRWDKNNTDQVASEEWQERLQELYKERAEIYGKNFEVEELLKRKSKIKSRTKVRGVWNYNYLTEQDIKELEQIDARMDALTSGPKPDLSDADYARVKIINHKIKAMTKKDVMPEYKEKLRTLHKNVRMAYNVYRDAKSKLNANSTLTEIEEVTVLEKEYFTKEQEFADFYNKYNNATYVVGQNIIASGTSVPDKPKAFLIKTMPKDPNDYELVPNKKYRYKRLKDAAYNPNYQESFVKSRFGGGMMPMPKGVKFNTTTKQFEVDPRSKNVNPKFLELQKNQAAMDFYNKWVIENFLLKQKQASGRPLGFNLPFVQQLGLENVMSKGLSGLSREYKEKVQELMYGGSEFEKATNESGMVGSERVKFKENTAMPADLTTTNGIEAIVNWNAGFFANRELAGISVELTAVEDFLKKLIDDINAQGTIDETLKAQRTRQIENILDLVTFNKQKFIYGQVWEAETNPNKWLNRKTMRIIMQAASFGRMAFDIPMQVGNLLSGNVQTFIGTAGSKHANSDDFIAAKKMLYTRFLPKLLADYGKQSGLSYETMLYQYMNPSSKTLDRMMDANTVSKLRRVANRVFNITDLAMVLQDKGEMEIAMTTMLAILNHRTYKVFEVDQNGDPVVVNGEKVTKKNADGTDMMVTGIDAFTFHNGEFGPRKDVDISEQDIKQLQGTILLEMYYKQGNYPGYTKTKIGSTLLGSLFEFYRKYLIPAVSNRFAFGETAGVGSAYSWESGEAHMGYYVALMKSVQYYGFGRTAKNFLYDALLPGLVQRKLGVERDTQDYYRGKSAMAAREILLAIAFYTLYQMLRASLYDDDEEDLTYAELMMFRALVKVSNESRSMTPVPVVGKPGDYIEQFGTFTTAFREGETVWNLVQNALFYASYQTTGSDFAYERGFYQRDTDRYEEGDPKIWKNVSDLTGFSNISDVMSAEGALTAAKAATRLK